MGATSVLEIVLIAVGALSGLGTLFMGVLRSLQSLELRADSDHIELQPLHRDEDVERFRGQAASGSLFLPQSH